MLQYIFSRVWQALATVLLVTLIIFVIIRVIGDPTHLMLLIGYVGSYSIVLTALVALGVHVSRVGQRIVKALEVASEK